MSDQIPCPTCQSMLRIPPTAAMIRCPKCKTVLAVEPADGPAPAPPPPPASKPAAPPLPFGRPPAKAAPLPPPPKEPARPAKVSAQAPVRARLAPVQTDDLKPTAPKPNETSEEAAKRQQMREALAKLEEREAREKERFEVISEECRWGRLGLKLLGGGSAVSAAAGAIFCLYLVTLVTIDGFAPLLGLAALCLLVHFLLLAGGFGCCAAGPEGVRGAAITGAVCTVLQLVLAVAAASMLTKSVNMDALTRRSDNAEAFLISAMLLGCVFNNLSAAVMLSLFVVMAKSLGANVPLGVLVLPLVAGFADFAKLSLVGIVGNRYATEAKDEEQSHESSRFVHRVFAAVLVAAVLFPLSVPASYVLSDTMGFGKSGTSLMSVLTLPVGAVQNGFILWTVYAWFAQYQTLFEIVEVVVPTRVASKAERIDSY